MGLREESVLEKLFEVSLLPSSKESVSFGSSSSKLPHFIEKSLFKLLDLCFFFYFFFYAEHGHVGPNNFNLLSRHDP